MSSLHIWPNDDPLEEVKEKVSKAEATDTLYISVYSVVKEVGKLRGILDTLQKHLNNKYEKDSFTYVLS